MSSKLVIRFVGAIAISEVISTAIFLDEFRTDIVLVAFALAGMFLVWFGVSKVERLAEWIMRAD